MGGTTMRSLDTFTYFPGSGEGQGIVYYKGGNLEAARNSLQTSLKQFPSAKATMFARIYQATNGTISSGDMGWSNLGACPDGFRI